MAGRRSVKCFGTPGTVRLKRGAARVTPHRIAVFHRTPTSRICPVPTQHLSPAWRYRGQQPAMGVEHALTSACASERLLAHAPEGPHTR